MSKPRNPNLEPVDEEAALRRARRACARFKAQLVAFGVMIPDDPSMHPQDDAQTDNSPATRGRAEVTK